MMTLDHINIRTTRMEETLVFFERVLGFRRSTALTNPDPAQNVWLLDEHGRASVHINVFREGEEVPETNLSCLHHIAFAARGRDAVQAHLDALQEPYVVVETRVLGLVQFNLTDPNGVRVEISVND